MKFRTFALGTIAAAAATFALAAPASAYVNCNSRGDCWHSTERYDYKPNWHIRIHDDNWRMSHRYHLREHEGRGYWRSGVWVSF